MIILIYILLGVFAYIGFCKFDKDVMPFYFFVLCILVGPAAFGAYLGHLFMRYILKEDI
jgi:hypothetical protein